MSDVNYQRLSSAFVELLEQHLRINVLPENQNTTRNEWLVEAGLNPKPNTDDTDRQS